MEKEKIDHGKKPLLNEYASRKEKKRSQWQPRVHDAEGGTSKPTEDEPLNVEETAIVENVPIVHKVLM